MTSGSSQKGFDDRPEGDKAIEHTKRQLHGSDCVRAFEKFITLSKTLPNSGFKWRKDNGGHLNIKKGSSSGGPTTVLLRPRGSWFDLHLYFERSTPAHHDARLSTSTKDKTRAMTLRVSTPDDIDLALEKHLQQVYGLH